MSVTIVCDVKSCSTSGSSARHRRDASYRLKANYPAYDNFSETRTAPCTAKTSVGKLQKVTYFLHKITNLALKNRIVHSTHI